MPELPEVEIAARNLRTWTKGRGIDSVDADRGARYVFRPAGPAAFARALRGARFRSVRRIGKNLLLSLEKDRAPMGLLAHLGMTGKWLLRAGVRGAQPHRDPRHEDTPRFSRARFHLDDGSVLHFCDMRLFGRLRVVPGARFEEVPEIAALGPDPIEEGIDRGRLHEGLARSKLPVKVRILDQRLLPGVGNILASEALFRARIDPRRRSESLSRREAGALADAVLASVRESIALEEGPEITYVEEPGAENPFLVYAREGERCPRCRRAAIARLVQAQRSTFFCPRCQR
jgi:formamidopyrimidine-DNA glycosylase